MEPVRQHFTHDETARELLAKVQQYKRDDASKVTEKTIRRLNLSAAGKVRSHAHLVVAQLPVANPTLQLAVDLLTMLRAGDEASPKVLLLPDWSARVCSALDADPKVISAYYIVL